MPKRPCRLSPRSEAAALRLIEQVPGTGGWRALHTGCERSQAAWASLLGEGEGEPAAELMSLADWVCALAQCFDPKREGAGSVPPALSRFLQKQQAAAPPPAGQSAAAEQGQASTTATTATQPLAAVTGSLNSMSRTMSTARAFAPSTPGAPPKIGKIGKRAINAILRDDEALARISAASPFQIAFSLTKGISLASAPSALRNPGARLFVTTEADTLDFSAPVPPTAEPLAVRDTLRIILLARRESREQLISSGSLFPAFANRFPEVISQLMANILHPGLHTEQTILKITRNSDIVTMADSLARGEFTSSNIIRYALNVSTATASLLFSPGTDSRIFSSYEHSEIILLDRLSQVLMNRCLDAFLWHAVGIKGAFSTWWNQAGACLLICLLEIPASHLLDAPMNPEALAKISKELRQIFARVSEAVRQLSPNFDQLNLTELLGEGASNLLSVAKHCAEGLPGASAMTSSSIYEMIQPSAAAEYYRLCADAPGDPEAASWSTPKGKRGAPATPTRPGKLSRTEGQQSCDPSEAEPYGGSAKSWRPHYDSSEIGETSSDDDSDSASRSSKSKGESDAAEEVVSFHTQGTPLTFHDGSGRPRLLTLSQLLDQDPEFLENSHDYMQALFPLDVESRAVPLSPVLSARQIKNLPSDTILEAEDFMRSLLEDQHESGNLGSHHYRRITRILKCLALCGLSQEASDFRDFAVELTGATRIANQYWDPAIEEADPDPEG